MFPLLTTPKIFYVSQYKIICVGLSKWENKPFHLLQIFPHCIEIYNNQQFNKISRIPDSLRITRTIYVRNIPFYLRKFLGNYQQVDVNVLTFLRKICQNLGNGFFFFLVSIISPTINQCKTQKIYIQQMKMTFAIRKNLHVTF